MGFPPYLLLTSKRRSPAQKMKFFIKEFFSKCDQIRSSLRILSHLLKKSLMENFIFCAVGGNKEADEEDENDNQYKFYSREESGGIGEYSSECTIVLYVLIFHNLSIQ